MGARIRQAGLRALLYLSPGAGGGSGTLGEQLRALWALRLGTQLGRAVVLFRGTWLHPLYRLPSCRQAGQPAREYRVVAAAGWVQWRVRLARPLPLGPRRRRRRQDGQDISEGPEAQETTMVSAV